MNYHEDLPADYLDDVDNLAHLVQSARWGQIGEQEALDEMHGIFSEWGVVDE